MTCSLGRVLGASSPHLPAVLVVATLAGCEPSSAPVDVGPPCGSGTFDAAISIDHVDRIDLVVVVSGARVGPAALDAFVRGVESGLSALLTGDVDGDALVDFRPFRSVRVLVVSADVGDDGQGLSGCTPTGGDGLFLSCGAEPWTTFAAGTDLAAGLSAVGCAVRSAAAATCARARPLDAARLALLPASSSAVAGRVAHGDVEHAGFSRRLAGLGLLFVAPQDDCSGGRVPTPSGTVEAACLDAPALTDVEVAAADLAALRASSALVLASVLGGYARSATDLLELDELAAVVPVVRADGSIAPACDMPPISARPAPRLAAFLRALRAGGAGVSAEPLCRPDAPWVAPFVELDSEPLGSSCLTRSFPRGPDGLVDCELRLTLPPTADRDLWASCAALGTASLGASPDEPDREICLVPQVRSAAEFGAGYAYAYDDGPETAALCNAWFPPGQTLLFSLEARDLDTGSLLELECQFFDPADAGAAGCEW